MRDTLEIFLSRRRNRLLLDHARARKTAADAAPGTAVYRGKDRSESGIRKRNIAEISTDTEQ